MYPDALDRNRTTYTPALGIPELRQAIARHYARTHEVDVDPGRVVVTAVASAALLLLTAALVNPGDEVPRQIALDRPRERQAHGQRLTGPGVDLAARRGSEYAMPNDDPFDAVQAAAELDAALASEGPSTAEIELARTRERLEREADREVARRSQRVLLDMIAVLDDLDRALETARGAADGSALRQGVELVQRAFLAALAKHGVSPMAAAGEPFDPLVHEAVGVVPAAGEREAGRVVAVLRRGYRLGDQLLRPAAVLVGKLGAGG